MAEQVTIKLNVDDRAARARLAQLEARAAAVGRGVGTGGGGPGGIGTAGIAGAAYVASAGQTVGTKTAKSLANKLQILQDSIRTLEVGSPSIVDEGTIRFTDQGKIQLDRLAANGFVRANPTLIGNINHPSNKAFSNDVFRSVEDSKFAVLQSTGDIPAFKSKLNSEVLRGARLQGSSWYEGVALNNQYQAFKQDGVFQRPLGTATVATGRQAGLYRRISSNLDKTLKIGKFNRRVEGIIAKQLTSSPIFGKVSLGQLKEIAPMVGVITGAMEVLEATNQIASARSEYYKKLLLTDEVPDGDYISEGYNIMLDRIGLKAGTLSHTVLYSVPSTILELGVGVFLEDGGTNEKALGMALDMVSQSLRDELGLNADAYQQLRVSQDRWQESYTKLLGQVKSTTSKQAQDVAARMQGLGLSGVSRSDLKDSAFTHLIGPAIDKADAEFQKSNPFPTNRDVNPYGVDESVRKDILTYTGPAGALYSYFS